MAFPLRSAALSLALLCGFTGCASDRSASSTSDEDGLGADEGSADDIPTRAEIERWETRREHPERIAFGLHSEAPPLVRARAALALARLQHHLAVDPLLRALRDPAPLVRKNAAFGLGQLDEAFDDARASHVATRDRVSTHLVGTVDRDTDLEVQRAMVRAMGRVGRAKALPKLAALARSGALRAEALMALGVNATRDAPQIDAVPAIAEAIHLGLADRDGAIVEAAAYAAFRQQLPLSDVEISQIAAVASVQARIHLLRALRLTPRRAPAKAIAVWLKDLDWRVRLRALDVAGAAMRAGNDYSAALLQSPLDAALSNVERGQLGGDGHVISAACFALATTRPDAGRAFLDDAFRRLAPLLPQSAVVRCSCAVAKDAIDGVIDAVRTCDGGAFDPVSRRRLEIAVIQHAGIPSPIRARSLEVALKDAEPLVRLDAATVASEDDTEAVAKMAAKALSTETDPGVIAAHLSGFVGKRRTEMFDEFALSRVVRTLLRAPPQSDTLEPLLVAAQIASERGFTATTGLLVTADDVRVVDKARGISLLDRELGPRATVPDAVHPELLPAQATVTTERGTFVLEFLRDVAPLTVASFVALASQGVTIGTTFHRVVPDFVAQGGDPRGDGYGGPGFTIPCERSDERYSTGTVGMALAGLDTGGSQFFIVHSAQPHLEGRYSVFARVKSGIDVVDLLQPSDRITSIAFK